MTHLSRDVLIKSFIAKEMSNAEPDGPDYIKHLKDLYHKWEHQSSEILCSEFNKINETNITVQILKP